MALKITKASDPISIETIIMLIYGSPGLGKSTLGMMAKDPLTLDFDKGAHRAGKREDSVRIDNWQDVASMEVGDFEGYETIVVDTIGRALDALAVDIIRREPKMGRGGSLTLQGWGQLKSEFQAWTNLLRSFGKDVVLIAHADEKQQGDDIIERLDISGSSKNEVYKVSDAMGRLSVEQGQRVLNFTPGETQFGKDPAELGSVKVPHYAKEPGFLASLIVHIKEKLNTQSEEQQKVAAALDKFAKKVKKAKEIEDFNELLEDLEDFDGQTKVTAKALIWDHAKGQKMDGFFDREKGEFVAPDTAEEGA